MNNKDCFAHSFRVFWGLVAIGSGLLLLAFQWEWLPGHWKGVIFSWPSLLVLFGVVKLFWGRGPWLGLALMGAGAYFLLHKMGYYTLSLGGVLVPLLLVYGGIVLLFRHRHSRAFCKAEKPQPVVEAVSENGFEENCIFSGANRSFRNQVFRGGEVNCVFGGAELDFTGATLAEGQVRLELNCVFGGAVLHIPENWNVQVRVRSVFGGVVDRSRVPVAQKDPGRSLLLSGRCVFGGAEVKYHPTTSV